MATPTAAEWLEFLIDSARYGDTDDVRTAIKEGVDVDGVDESQRTGARRCARGACAHRHRRERRLACVQAAPAAGHIRIASATCESLVHALKSDAADASPDTHAPPRAALHMAAANGHAAITLLLLDANAVSGTAGGVCGVCVCVFVL